MRKAIIFGSGGQDGFYLTKILQENDVAVHAFTHQESDVGLRVQTLARIKFIQPDYIFHLAARSTTNHEAWQENQGAIVDGTLNILEAVKETCPMAKVFITGSILQLSLTGSGNIGTEQKNGSIYAAQRNASVAYARYYRSLGLDVYVGYFSYHDSPRRSAKHLAARLALELKHAAATGTKVKVNDPLDTREWNFAGDMMKAVWAQVNGGIMEAVLGCGISHTIQDYAQQCMLWIDPKKNLSDVMQQVFTREGPIISRTNDLRFRHCFLTSLPELAEMMVNKTAAQPVHIGTPAQGTVQIDSAQPPRSKQAQD